MASLWLTIYEPPRDDETLASQILEAAQRYLLFAYNRDRPTGGWGDFVGTFVSLDEALAKADTCERNGMIGEIVDLTRLKAVFSLEPDWHTGTTNARSDAADP